MKGCERSHVWRYPDKEREHFLKPPKMLKCIGDLIMTRASLFVGCFVRCSVDHYVVCVCMQYMIMPGLYPLYSD